MTAPLVTDNLRRSFTSDGFALVDRIVSADRIAALRDRFEALFRGTFETGVEPDEVNWQYETGDPSLTRQICNGWKADTTIAATVLDPAIGEALARLGGWTGARLIQDNVRWKPAGARSLGFHCDNAYSTWFTPTDMLTCWIALDDTSASGGTLEFVRGSHRWESGSGAPDRPAVQFHGPKDYRAPISGHEGEIVPVEVAAGGGSFHDGWTWHGSGPNVASTDRRALVIHAAPIDVRFSPESLDEGMGPVYSRYREPDGVSMPDAHFPVLWDSTEV